MHEIEELKRQGLSIRAISRLTGFDRKTIRKYLDQPEAAPISRDGTCFWARCKGDKEGGLSCQT